MATVVAIITSMVVANATQTIIAPNAAFISYNLALGANSAPITPVTNKSVLVMGCSTTTGGVGHVSLLRFLGTEIDWSGVESPSGATTAGFNNQAGAHIVYLDTGGHFVDIRMASADTILIRNGSAGTLAGNVTLIW